MTKPTHSTTNGLSRREVLAYGIGGLIATASMSLPTSALAQQANTLRIGLNARDIGVLHPHVATGGNDVPVIASIFSGLVRYEPTRVNITAIQPDLAESWEMSDDFAVHTFHLRKGVQWHKGYGEVTSADVAYSLANVRDSEQSTFRPLYSNMGEIETPDDYTVVIHLNEPDPTFVTAMANWQGGFVICRKAVEEMGDLYRTEPVGSGPFQFERYTPQDNISLTAHKDYYAGAPALERVVYSYVPDETSRRFAFVQQELDIIQGASNEDWLTEVVNSTPGNPKVDLLGPARSVNLHMKATVEPLGNPLVRQAIAHAINRDDFEQFFGPVFKGTNSSIPPSYFGGLKTADIPDELKYGFDPEKSKALLAEAGFPDGFEISTVCSERGDYLALAQIVQERLSKVGIALKLDILDHGSWVAAIIKEKRGSLVWSISSRYPSAEYLMREFFLCDARVSQPSGVQGFAEYCNPDFDVAYQAAIASGDPDVRLEEFAKAQMIALKDLPVVPLGTMSTPVLRQGYVNLGYEIAEGDDVTSLPYLYQLSPATSV
ncbi:ABC transporter substrate-binding protein [Hoeflea ulvae]|uniref:ABC transporter substrate-binding protein n=1 Tax=Hoeflea ulvae TaxID=2983764 RepID=A0ABT3YCZ2_9HYPH|nr:ABC transporter substrate-binding protein [Hoeflea ulvae]MCY0093755.1 ABC transporter substrate-binding protein [Hoeflea ulvae]